MSEAHTAYPLSWPSGWARTNPVDRTRARFSKTADKSFAYADGTVHRYKQGQQLTIAVATGRVMEELRRMGLPEHQVVISTNLVLRIDGMPRSGQRDPDDPGVAVYWRDSSKEGWPQRCMAIDRYDRAADNLAAVAATLDAMRAIERHGGAEILDRAFTGFTALPPPDVKDGWRSVLDPDDPEGSYRRLRSSTHPDRHGGDHSAFQRVQSAWESYRQEQQK